MSAWILLRGLIRETRHWGDFPARLGEALDGARIVAIDLPGNGRLHAGQSPTRIEDMVAGARRDLAARGIAPPYRLVALSLGGMVATAWADRHPADIAGAVLINTSLRPFCPFYRRLRPGCYPRLLKLALLGGDEASWEEAIYDLTSARPAGKAGVLDDWIAWRRECTVTRANALRQLVAAMRFRAPATAPACPLLVLTSRGDALVDPRCSRLLAARWGTTFAEHPDAGHDLPLDDPAWVVERIRAWRASAPPARLSRRDGGAPRSPRAPSP